MEKRYLIRLGIIFLFFGIFFVSSFWTNNLNDDLEAYWPMNESSGTTADNKLGNASRDGIGVNITGSVWVTGKVGNAIKFKCGGCSGSGQALNMSFPINSSEGTLMVGVHTYQTGANRWVLGNDADDNGFGLKIDSGGKWQWGVENSSLNQFKFINSNSNVNNGTWTQHIFVWNSTGWLWYIDGSKQTETMELVAVPNVYWYLGGRPIRGGATEYFQGLIDEVAWYSRSFTDADVSNAYNGGDWVTYIDGHQPNSSLGLNPIDDFNSSSNTPTFDFKADGGEGISYIKLYGNWSLGWGANYTNTSYTNDTYLNITTDPIPDGKYIWGGFSNDTYGRDNFTNTNRTIWIDSTPPNITDVNFTTTTGNQVFDFSSRVHDNFDIASCQYFIINNTDGVLDTANTTFTHLLVILLFQVQQLILLEQKILQFMFKILWGDLETNQLINLL